MERYRYRIHGLTVDSEIALPALLAEGANSPRVSVVLEMNLRELSQGEGEIYAARDEPQRFRVWRNPDGFMIEASAATAHIDCALSRVRVAPANRSPESALGQFVLGSALSAVVVLGGGLVLHASAACSKAGALVVAGPSGAGKSTLCAMLCRAGFELLADDAVRIEPTPSNWLVHQGATEVRLREDVIPAFDLSDWVVRPTPDGRLAVGAPPSRRSRNLRCVVFPRFTDAATMPSVRELSAREAAVLLLRNLRIGSWRDAAVLREQTRAVAEVARTVTAFEVTLSRESLSPDGATRIADVVASATEAA